MRPLAPTSTKAAGLARARMLMKAKLGWLAGYPSPHGWIVVPEEGDRPGETLVLTRDHLRRATYTAAKLRGEFPRALPKLVGNVDAWHAAVSEVLAALKPWVHHGDAPPAELFHTEIHSRTARARARALREQHPALRGLVDALSWVLATRAAAAPKALAWVEREAMALRVAHEHLDPETAGTLSVRCVYLAAAVGPKALAPLMRLIGEPTGYQVPTHAVVEHCQATQTMIEQAGRERPIEPGVELPAALTEAVRWLLAQDPATAKRWLALLERCDLPPLLLAWNEWWPPMRKLIASGHAIRNHEDETPQRKQRLAALRRQLLAHRERIPGELKLPELLEALQPLAESGFAEGHAPACRVLGRLSHPELASLRAGLVIGWSHLHRTPPSWLNPRRLPLLLRGLDEHLRDRPVTPARLAPWRETASRFAARGRGGHSLDQDLLEDELEAADIGRFFQALRWLETHAPELALDAVADAVVRQLEAVHDAELSARLVVELHRAKHHDKWLSATTLRAAWQVCTPEPGGYARIVRALERIEGETGLSPTSLTDGMGAVLGQGLPLLRELLLDEDLGPLVKCGRKLAVLHALGDALHPAPRPSASGREWIAAYPTALHGDLVWLCDQTPQAEPLAAKLLRSIHHGTDAIDDERRAIEGLLPQAPPERRQALQARLHTLERRRSAPPPTPSPEKLERLRDKLRRRGGLARLEALESAADMVLPGAVARELGLPFAPPWALEDRVLALLVPLRREAPATRGLARTLMRARAGAPPWDLREHPANATFLAMLRKRGIDPAPWLDGIGTIEVGQGTARMKLSLEDDPLEVFHMGRCFGTCLSPGQCNFFSVFANAADINKRVLYARDAHGGVLGRRLLCLTQDGAVLAFHAYCHDAGAGFEETSADFARQLARTMGTVVVGRATVPCLVAPAWYDDGPVDIAGQFDALKDGSSFRQALAQVPAEGLPGLLATAFTQAKLDEVLAPMVLALPELAERSELALALLALVHHPEHLPLQGCQQLARLLIRAGDCTTAAELLAEPMAAALWQQHREHRWMDFGAIEELASLAPSRALELLRRTRERGTRGWEAETQPERLLTAGVAMEALRRPAQAIRLYRRATATDGVEAYKQQARKRLAALE
jgi:hypothetical protein